MAGFSSHPWDAKGSTTLMICRYAAAALASGWIRKTKAMCAHWDLLSHFPLSDTDLRCCLFLEIVDQETPGVIY